MKLGKSVSVLAIVMFGLICTVGFITNLASARPLEDGDGVTAVSATLPVIDDFEDGGTNIGLFSDTFDGAAGAQTAVVTNSVEMDSFVIPVVTQTNVLSFTYDLVINDWGYAYGGFQHEFDTTQDWSQYDGFSFLIYGENSGNTIQVELWDNGATAASSERFDTDIVDDFVGWKQFKLPFTDFTRGTDYQPGGAPDDGFTLTDMWGYSFGLVTSPSSGTFQIDDVILYVDPLVVDDFEDGGAEIGLFSDTFDGAAGAQTTVITNTIEMDSPVIPVVTTTNALSFTYDLVINDWGYAYGGFQHEFDATQDWSQYDGFTFFIYGENSGNTIQVELWDNGTTAASSERFDTDIVDDFVGWKLFKLPFSDFTRGTDYQPGGAPDDGFTLTDMWGYSFGLVTSPSSGTFQIDDVELYRDSGNVVLTVRLDDSAFSVVEGQTAVITATLNVISTDPVTVSYATSDGTAVAGTHYTATSGMLVFPAGSDSQTFTVDTIDNSDSGGDKALMLTLSNPVGAVLGTTSEATLTIQDDEATNICSTRTTTIDDFENGLPSDEDADGNPIGFFAWQDSDASTTVTFTTNLVSDSDPLALPSQSGDNHLYQVDVNIVSWGGTTHAFENIPVDTWTPQDWSSYEGISFWLYGQNTGNTLLFEIQDNRTPGSTSTDAEIWNYTFTDDFSGWQQFQLRFDEFTRKEIGNGAPNDGFGLEEVHAWAFGSLETTGADVTYYMDNVIICGNADTNKPLAVEFDQSKYSANEGETGVLTVTLNKAYTETVSVDYATSESNARVDRQYTPVSGTLTFAVSETVKTIEIPTMVDGKHTGNRNVAVNLYENNVPLDFQRRAILTIVDSNPADPRLVDDFEGYYPYTNIDGDVDLSVLTIMDDEVTAVPHQPTYEDVLSVDFDTTVNPVSFDRGFARGQDWSSYDGLDFWYYGSNSGETVALQLKDNMSATTSMVDTSEWVLVWSDEFNDPAGTPPNPNIWQHELGDGALNDIVGWGNSELQYYTNDPANAATDGNGNLVIRLQEVDTATTDLVCWYGPCEYTSARLITKDRIDFEFGRIEARVQLPTGPDGLWPAFWMLGSNIDESPWPQSGEIDIMEYVSRRPDEVFGTLHGPGYSGGNAYGDIYTFPGPVAATTHTFAIEWSLDSIDWYVDDIHYHDAIPADVSPNEWVYNHPFFTILNMAIGGNFGGAVSDSMTMPQETLVDYVRVYQAADTAERFEATFVDDFTGWQRIQLPWTDFVRSSDQPVDAPDDGLTLTEVWGYGFVMPEGTTGAFYLDQVYLYNMNTYYFPFMFKN